MIPSSPQTPRVPLASIINIDSPVSMVSSSVPHSPFATSYARRLSGNENEPPMYPTTSSRRSSYSSNPPSRRSSHRVSTGSISSIAEDHDMSSSTGAFDAMMARAIVGSERVSTHNTITPYVDENMNLPTPVSSISNRSRLSTSSYPRTPLTTANNSISGTPISKMTVQSFSSALRTPLGQRSAADSNVNRLSPAAQRFIATSIKPTQQHSISSPRKFVNQQRQNTTSIHSHSDSLHSDSILKKFPQHSDENNLVENMHHLSITPRNNSAAMMLSPAPLVSNKPRSLHTRMTLIGSSSVGSSFSDATSNIRKMR